jgi:hypothetical protein
MGHLGWSCFFNIVCYCTKKLHMRVASRMESLPLANG